MNMILSLQKMSERRGDAPSGADQQQSRACSIASSVDCTWGPTTTP